MFPKRRITMGGDVFRDEYSLLFDGTDDYISIGANASLYPNDADWAISFWFKSTNAEEEYIVSGGDESDKGFFQFKLLGNTTGAIRCFLYDKDNTQELAFNTAVTGLNDGTWHHFAYTLDWSSKKGYAYVDGVYTSSATNTNVVTLANDDDGIHIGKRYSADDKYFTGSVSEMAIYNRFLSASEVTQIYNGREPFNHLESSFKSNLKAWWRMGDGTFDHFDTSGDATYNRGLITDETDIGIGLELISDGNFGLPEENPWTLGSGWSIGSGVATRASGESSNSAIEYNGSDAVAAGNVYKYSFDYNVTVGNFSAYLGGTTIDNSFSGSGTTTGYITSTSGSEFAVYGLTSAEGTLDNVSVKLVSGNAGTMINMAATDFEGDTP